MLIEEAVWLRKQFEATPGERLSPLINIGSSTFEFRTVTHPFVHREIFGPLAERGVEVVHQDLKQDAGVDVPGDLLDDAVLARLGRHRPRSVLCSNVLEHVADRNEFVSRLASLLSPGGLLFLTVPRSFPYHPDPIDNRFRPSASVLAGLLPGWRAVAAADVACSRRTAVQSGNGAVRRYATRLVSPWKGGEWLGAMHGLLWIFRDYSQACVVLEKP